jgi:hypothetical protein
MLNHAAALGLDCRFWPIATDHVAAQVVQPHELDRYRGEADVGFVASR